MSRGGINAWLLEANDATDELLLNRNDVEGRLTQWSVRFREPLLAMAVELSNRVPGNMKSSTKHWARERVEAALTRVRDLNLTGTAMRDLIVREGRRIEAERKPKRKPKTPKKTAKKRTAKVT